MVGTIREANYFGAASSPAIFRGQEVRYVCEHGFRVCEFLAKETKIVRVAFNISTDLPILNTLNGARPYARPPIIEFYN